MWKYEVPCVPFSIHVVPSYFAMMINEALERLHFSFACLDDIIMYSETEEESCSKLVISVTEHLVEVVDKLSTTAVVFFRSERILKYKCLYGA